VSDFSKTKPSSQVGLVKRRTTAQIDGRQMKAFPSTTLKPPENIPLKVKRRTTAQIDGRQMKAFPSTTLKPPENIPLKAFQTHTSAIYQVQWH
jgi:hypothetical protein